MMIDKLVDAIEIKIKHLCFADHKYKSDLLLWL